MKKTVRVQLVANAGVLVEYDGIKFLIDGIFDEDTGFFSKIPSDTQKQLIMGVNEFSGIDYILFTHNHTDHFSARDTITYLKNNNPKYAFLPDMNLEETKAFQDLNLKKHINYEILNLNYGEYQTKVLQNDISVTVFCTTHMGAEFKDIYNYCYLLKLGEMQILFTGDADITMKNFDIFKNEQTVSTVFVNPLFFNQRRGREIINDLIKPSQVGIYHIPFLNDDKSNFQKLVKRDMEKHFTKKYDIFALTYHGQVEELTKIAVEEYL